MPLALLQVLPATATRSPSLQNIDSDSNISSALLHSIPPPDDVNLNSSDMLEMEDEDMNLDELMKQKVILPLLLRIHFWAAIYIYNTF